MKFLNGFFIQVDKLDGKWGKVMKNYLIVSFVLIPLIVIFFIIKLCCQYLPPLYHVFGTPILYSVFATPITDEVLLERIVTRIDEEGVPVTVSPNGIVQVWDANTARRMRMILISEDLTPETINPWAVFENEITDSDGNIIDIERKKYEEFN